MCEVEQFTLQCPPTPNSAAWPALRRKWVKRIICLCQAYFLGHMRLKLDIIVADAGLLKSSIRQAGGIQGLILRW